MTFLSSIPTIGYDFTIKTDNSDQVYAVADVLTKVSFYLDTETLLNLCGKYEVIANETPDQIAYAIYGDSNLHWTILYINNIMDMGSQWPLPDRVIFDLVENPDEVKYYEYQGLVADQVWLIERYGDAYPVTNLEHEQRLNDKKRNILIVQPRNIGIFVEAFMNAING